MMFFFESEKSIMERVSELNWFIISMIIILAFIGFAMLYSAAGGNFQPWLIKQLLYFIIFFPLMILIAITDIKFWFKFSYFFYFISLLLIIAVDIAGHNSMGATRWFKIGGLNLQPSEPMKVCLVLAMAKYFYNIEAEDIEKIRYTLIPILMVVVPVFFIFDQPDLGTATIVVMVGITVLFAAGLKLWKFLVVGISGLMAIPFLWKFVLYDYQRKRILNFFNPGSDPLGSGYNIIQSKIAIGSGGFFGKGFLNGTQGQLDFLPERQTDFIFTMLSEELGFVGSVFTVAIYSILIFAGISISLKTKHQYGKLIATGIIAILFIHVFINMGMVTGLVPVVGAPLPLISYGGTITASMLIGFGLLLNVDLYKDVDLKK